MLIYINKSVFRITAAYQRRSIYDFPGEKIQWEKEKQTTVHASDSKINEKYMAGEVRIVTEQARYPLDTITGMVSSGKYNLMPTFQATASVGRRKKISSYRIFYNERSHSAYFSV